MQAVDILHAEIGTVSSRADHSAAFRVLTPELRPSEAGALMLWHGKACRVTITPLESTEEPPVCVETERDEKTPSERLRAVLFVLWKETGKPGTFNDFYRSKIENIIEKVKAKLPPQ